MQVPMILLLLLSTAAGSLDPPLPDPNPATLMTTITVPGASDAGAVYPDGSPARLELNFTGSAGWVIHLSGGGWRFMANTTGRSHVSDVPPLVPDGAPAPSAQGCYGTCDGIMSVDSSQNPLFHEWNKVFIPISGTSFTGDRDTASPYPVRGARILAAVIGHLQASYSMAKATDVILTGGSSGGLAAYLTCDRVADMVRSANASTRYSCLADAGLFLDHTDYRGVATTSPQFEQSFYAWNSSGGTNQDCIKHYTPLGTPEKCIFAQYVIPFIKAPLFIMQNLYDSWQLAHILGVTDSGGCRGYGAPGLSGCQPVQVDAIQGYGMQMRVVLASAALQGHGIFAPSCIAHCQSVENEHPAALWQWPARWGLGDFTPAEAFNQWYSGGGGMVQMVQQCNWSSTTCNAKCPMYT